jgi:hypothetical protein
MSEQLRSRASRHLAETALGRIVTAYGTVPEFVLLGGLVPDLLCASALVPHEGTTDVDVQVDLEIANGSANAARLETALTAAGFVPDDKRAWRWQDHRAPGMIVKAEFLTDLDDVPNQTTVLFDACQHLGAVNLRGTGFAARDWEIRNIEITINNDKQVVALRVTGVAGYLLAKIHAAYGRRAPKDWYDIAYVLIHNDLGGPTEAATRVGERFAADLVGQTRTAIDDLTTNFADTTAQGSEAYAEIMLGVHPEQDWATLTNDAVTAVEHFVRHLKLPQ